MLYGPETLPEYQFIIPSAAVRAALLIDSGSSRFSSMALIGVSLAASRMLPKSVCVLMIVRVLSTRKDVSHVREVQEHNTDMISRRSTKRLGRVELHWHRNLSLTACIMIPLAPAWHIGMIRAGLATRPVGNAKFRVDVRKTSWRMRIVVETNRPTSGLS